MKDLAADFERFNAENPDVMRSLIAMARQAKRAGQARYGIAALFEVLRWDRTVVQRQGEEFKLNNNHRAFYARRIMEQCQDLAGFFETRTRHSQAHKHLEVKPAPEHGWQDDDDPDEFDQEMWEQDPHQPEEP